MTPPSAEVPAAVLALMSAVLEANPFAPPARLAYLLVEELRREGWHIGAPGSCRPSRTAVSDAAAPGGRRVVGSVPP